MPQCLQVTLKLDRVMLNWIKHVHIGSTAWSLQMSKKFLLIDSHVYFPAVVNPRSSTRTRAPGGDCPALYCNYAVFSFALATVRKNLPLLQAATA